MNGRQKNTQRCWGICSWGWRQIAPWRHSLIWTKYGLFAGWAFWTRCSREEREIEIDELPGLFVDLIEPASKCKHFTSGLCWISNENCSEHYTPQNYSDVPRIRSTPHRIGWKTTRKDHRALLRNAQQWNTLGLVARGVGISIVSQVAHRNEPATRGHGGLSAGKKCLFKISDFKFCKHWPTSPRPRRKLLTNNAPIRGSIFALQVDKVRYKTSVSAQNGIQQKRTMNNSLGSAGRGR